MIMWVPVCYNNVQFIPPHRNRVTYHVGAILCRSLDLPHRLLLPDYGNPTVMAALRFHFQDSVARDVPHVDALHQIRLLQHTNPDISLLQSSQH